MTTFRNVLLVTAVLASVLVSTSAGFAQGTPQQRAACTGDAFKLCASEIPNVGRITICMKANYSKLSPGCKAAFVKS